MLKYGKLGILKIILLMRKIFERKSNKIVQNILYFGNREGNSPEKKEKTKGS